MKLFKNKKFLIGAISVATVTIIATVAIILTNTLKKEEPKKEVSVLEKIELLSENNAADAAELIKKNIVKVTNTTDAGTITGTGFFHESGYLVTNSHIVDIEGEIEIEYYDGKKQKAALVANDITSDIALLQVDKPKIKALRFGNTLTLKVTDELYAIGYPYAIEGEATVTKGILSARRSAGGIEYLQTDMSLNTGNSGGPLLNAKAEVFGMTTYATENASLGMSISAESLELIINKLLEQLKVEYLKEERPANALNTVLTEIGHKDEDIYKQKEIFDKIKEHHKEDEKHHDHDKDKKEEDKKDNNKENDKNKVDKDNHNKPEQQEPVVEKNTDTSLKTLSVKGYKLEKTGNPNDYLIVLRNKTVNKLDITAIPTDSKASVKIEGNGNFKKGIANKITITVTAEDPEIKTHYYIYLAISNSTFDGYGKLGLNIEREYVKEYKETCVYISPYYMTSDGTFLNPETLTSVVEHYEVEIYEGFISNKEMEPIRLLKKYNIYPTGIETGSSNEVYVPLNPKSYIRYSEIRALLKEEDYKYEYGARYSVKVKAVGYDGKTAEWSISQTITK